MGYCEVPHTADLALSVWAKDIPGLFLEAVRGMAALMELKMEPGQYSTREFTLAAQDAESLLVAFLSEVLYWMETDQAGYLDIEIRMENFHLLACLVGNPIKEQSRQIKAVTFHNLAIQHTERGLETVIVFDV